MKKIDRINSFKKHSDKYKWLKSLKDQPLYLICKFDKEEICLEMELCLMRLLDLYPKCNSPCEEINNVLKDYKSKEYVCEGEEIGLN